MLLRSYQQITSRIAIFLVLFASLAPSISHAIATQNKGSSFLQEICSRDGIKKIVLQTVTTQGQQFATVLDAKSPTEHSQSSAVAHLEHCPFCGSAVANVAIASPSTAWVFMLAEQAKSIDFDYVTPVQPSYIQTAHPTRAPPVL